MKTLGTTFKKDVGKIRSSLTSVSESEILKFISSKELDIAGLKLTDEHLQVTRYFDEEHPNYQAHFTNEVLVILDTALDQELIKEGLARELVNRIQRLRKKVKFRINNDFRLVFNPPMKYYTIFR
jgi:isoleucyl-tRNA synthetase